MQELYIHLQTTNHFLSLVPRLISSSSHGKEPGYEAITNDDSLP